MTTELIAFLVMVGVFLLGCFLCKLPVSLSMVLASVAGAIAGGQGLALRHLVEGMFAYVDTIMVIATAMIFMKVIQESGALDAIASLIIQRFHKVPALMLIFIMVIIMFPGMITGSSTASVLSAGSIMAPVLMIMGVPVLETACILALGGVLGMIAPPTNIPAMIIGAGIDIPYSGFGLPLTMLTFPLAFLFVLMFGYKYVKNMNYVEVEAKLNTDSRKRFGFKVYIPLLLAIVLMVLNKAVPAIPDIGMPLVFLISAVVGCFTGYKFNFFKAAKESVHSALPCYGHPDGRRYVHPGHDAHRRARPDRDELPEPAEFCPLLGAGYLHARFRRDFLVRLGKRAGRPVPAVLPCEGSDHRCRSAVSGRFLGRYGPPHGSCGHFCGKGRRHGELYADSEEVPDPLPHRGDLGHPLHCLCRSAQFSDAVLRWEGAN